MRTAKWATGVVGFIVAGYDSVEFFVKKSATSKSSGLDSVEFFVKKSATSKWSGLQSSFPLNRSFWHRCQNCIREKKLQQKTYP